MKITYDHYRKYSKHRRKMLYWLQEWIMNSDMPDAEKLEVGKKIEEAVNILFSIHNKFFDESEPSLAASYEEIPVEILELLMFLKKQES